MYNSKKRIYGFLSEAGKRTGKVLTFISIFMATVFTGTACCPLFAYALTGDELLEANRRITVESNEIENWPEGPTVGAESAILIEADTGAILYEKNIHAKEYPASTTKILTCLIAAEKCSNDEMVTFSHDAVYDTPRDSNNIAIDAGQSMTVMECLQAILIRSANECAYALAEHVTGGDRAAFVELMNERAAELGCVDSHFANPNGLPNDDHYTSAYDLAQIGRAFFANEMLCEITRMTQLHIYPSANQPDEIIENSTDLMLAGKTYEYPYLVGAKTGYTDVARSCLVSCAEKDGVRLICVVMKDEAPNQYTDTISLFDYGFSNFSVVNVSETETKYNISSTGSFYSGIDILGSSRPLLELNSEDCIIVPRTVDFSELDSTISYETEDENQAAIITYSYGGVWLGQASVDFVKDEDEGYGFSKTESYAESADTEGASQESSQGSSESSSESSSQNSSKEADNSEQSQEEKQTTDGALFLNVKIIGIYAGAGCLAAAAVFFIVRGIRSYRKRHPNYRADWMRDRRRRKSGKHILSIEKEAQKNRAALLSSDRKRERGRKKIGRRMEKIQKRK